MWMAHSEELKDCFLFDICPELEFENDFITSQIECEYDSPTTTTTTTQQ